MQPILDSLPPEWEVLEWVNGGGGEMFDNAKPGTLYVHSGPQQGRYWNVSDLSVYGRYAAISWASHDLIYVQDDDVVVSDPAAIVDEWIENGEAPGAPDGPGNGHLVANMPPEFRIYYPDSALVGFGACFHREAPSRAFARWWKHMVGQGFNPGGVVTDEWHRTSDVVFTTLTPRVLVDVSKTNLPHAYGPDRMYRQPGHVAERTRMLELARKARDA